MLRTLPAIAVTVFTACAGASGALAQDTAPDSGAHEALDLPEVLSLRRGQVAPRDGLLIDAQDLIAISLDVERLQFLLRRTEERDRQTCEVRVQQEMARARAADERTTLHDGLWEGRQRELVTAVEQARRAAERQWYEQPVLWLGLGALVASLVAILVAQL